MSGFRHLDCPCLWLAGVVAAVAAVVVVVLGHKRGVCPSLERGSITGLSGASFWSRLTKPYSTLLDPPGSATPSSGKLEPPSGALKTEFGKPDTPVPFSHYLWLPRRCARLWTPFSIQPQHLQSPPRSQPGQNAASCVPLPGFPRRILSFETRVIQAATMFQRALLVLVPLGAVGLGGGTRGPSSTFSLSTVAQALRYPLPLLGHGHLGPNQTAFHDLGVPTKIFASVSKDPVPDPLAVIQHRGAQVRGDYSSPRPFVSQPGLLKFTKSKTLKPSTFLHKQLQPSASILKLGSAARKMVVGKPTLFSMGSKIQQHMPSRHLRERARRVQAKQPPLTSSHLWLVTHRGPLGLKYTFPNERSVQLIAPRGGARAAVGRAAALQAVEWRIELAGLKSKHRQLVALFNRGKTLHAFRHAWANRLVGPTAADGAAWLRSGGVLPVACPAPLLPNIPLCSHPYWRFYQARRRANTGDRRKARTPSKVGGRTRDTQCQPSMSQERGEEQMKYLFPPILPVLGLALERHYVGDLLGDKPSDPTEFTWLESCLLAYIRSLPLSGLGFLASIRYFLQAIRIPGEGQKIDRICQAFGRAYCEANPDSFFFPENIRTRFRRSSITSPARASEPHGLARRAKTPHQGSSVSPLTLKAKSATLAPLRPTAGAAPRSPPTSTSKDSSPTSSSSTTTADSRSKPIPVSTKELSLIPSQSSAGVKDRAPASPITSPTGAS